MPTAVDRPRFRPDLEGLRGVAVLTVVAYHAGAGLPGGFIGVDVFFVLSGFLITRVLLQDVEEHGRPRFWHFLTGRLRRLLPAAALAIVVTSLLSYLVYSPTEHRELLISAGTSTLYSSNIFFAWRALDYFARATANPFTHLWSLSIEEQFYLAWPLVLMLGVMRAPARAGSDRLARARAITAALLVASFATSCALTMRIQPWAFFLPVSRAWEFLAGALVALGALHGLPKATAFTARAMTLAGVILVISAAVAFDDATPFPGTAALVPVFGALLIIAAGEGPECRGNGLPILEWRWLRALGLRSYALYLWHWPMLVLAMVAFPAQGVLSRALAVLGALILADLTLRWVERPIRYHSALLRSPLRSALVAASCVAVSLAVLWGWDVARRSALGESRLAPYVAAERYRSPLHANGCHAGYFDSTAAPCWFPSRTGTGPVVVLLGDSHAAQWSPALLELAERRRWRLVALTKTDCPAASLRGRIDSRYRRPYRECDLWRESAIGWIEELRPALVVTVSSVGNAPDVAAAWGAAHAETFRRLGAAADAVIDLEDAPLPGFDVFACLSRQVWFARLFARPTCDYPRHSRQAAFQLASRAAGAAYANVRSVDAGDLICRDGRCPSGTANGPEGVPVWFDNGHLTNPFVHGLATKLDSALAARGPVKGPR